VEEGDVVLEIGPGTGSLTAALLQAGATVFAVEKVRNVAFAWCSVAGLCADC
jgi:16S rRNA A1518/A1519 N6-dimethyltransferase RsmA/KsgA/DIM1 with predicted DNA glycosylase/AP lyase activity